MAKYVYLIKEKNSNISKIGYSKLPSKRLKELQTANSNELVIVAEFLTSNASTVEKVLHRRYDTYNTNGEWFDLPSQYIDRFSDTCQQIDENLNYLYNNSTLYD